jgi:glutamate N-acetyltransferase/amino-acid N-acetyltransferase
MTDQMLPSLTSAEPLSIEPRIPAGVRMIGGHSGIKASRLDTAILAFDPPVPVVGALTRNRCAAACVEGNRPLLPGLASGFIAVSGNANCYATGDVAADQLLRTGLDAALGQAGFAQRGAVLTATTGPIGVPFDAARVVAKLPELLAQADSWQAFSEAVLTTDTVAKVACFDYAGATWLGIAKGSGMIHPDMATMIAVCVTDAAVDPEVLRAATLRVVGKTFNAITVDRDTSTNDTALVFATGQAAQVADPEPALHAVFGALARAIARDGEGATRLVTVSVQGAANDEVARTTARDIAGSDLVKSALFACDPNWGRTVAALGASLARQQQVLDRRLVTIDLQGQRVFPPLQPLDKPALGARMRASDTIEIALAIGDGPGNGEAWGCDLSYDYVRINAEAPVSYGAVGSAEPVRSKLELQTLTPVLKKGVLREALRYLHDHDRQTMVILIEADSPTTDDDLALLRQTGIRPIVLRDSNLAAAVAVARDNHAAKLLILTDADGLLAADGHVASELGTPELPERFAQAEVQTFLEGGGTLHVINGLVHAALIEELFTDRGIGTMVRARAN